MSLTEILDTLHYSLEIGNMIPFIFSVYLKKKFNTFAIKDRKYLTFMNLVKLICHRCLEY